MWDYGTLNIRGNFQGDLDEIAEALNRFEFDQSQDRDQRFQVFDDRIETDRSYLCAVTAAFPVREWVVTKTGREVPANEYRELPDSDHVEWDSADYDDVTLAELSETIAPLLKRGTLELISVNGSQHERLAIHSDGCVQRLILECEEYESFEPKQTLEPHVESEEPSASLQDLVAKPMGSGTVINKDADDGSAALTAPDRNKRKVGVEPTMPDNETIVPKTRERYVADFLQLYEKSAEAKGDRGMHPVELTESEARREIEMYRLVYEAQRSLDYWEFGEFWDEIGFRRGAICKFVNIGKAYPSMLRYIEVGGPAAALEVGDMTQEAYHIWLRGGYARRWFEENGVKADEEPILPDNQTIVPKTREQYVSEFLQLYAKSAQRPTFRGIAALTESEARREIEMYRLAYEAQRSLDYWEFMEFWKEIGLKRGAICKFVHIGKAYPSMLLCIEVGGPAAADMVGLMTQIPYHRWFDSDYRRTFEEKWPKAETEFREKSRI
jgi:hypothetical protein